MTAATIIIEDVSFSLSTSSFSWGEAYKVCKLLPRVLGRSFSLDHRPGLNEVLWNLIFFSLLLLEIILHSFYPTC
jgi:hypothetical protein